MRRFLDYFGRRLVSALVTLFGITLVVFLLIHLVPGDPARTLLGPHATAGELAAVHREWGLNRPIWVQYGLYMSRLLRGDFGTSLFYRVPVSQLVLQRLLPTLLLMLFAAVLALVLALPLAAVAAILKGRIGDQVIRLLSLAGLGIPSVWIGIVLVLLVAIRANLLPVAGYGTSVPADLESLILPSLTIAIGMFPTLTRSLRVGLIAVLDSDYIASARARGLSAWRVLVRHGMRNAIAPTVTVLGLNIGYLVGSTVAIETIFALPGIGTLMVQAVLSRDFPIVQGVAIVYGILVLAVNLGTDLVHTGLDPQLELT